MQASQWIVMKFGGTSVAGAHCWQQIENIVQHKRQENLRVLLVCSAPYRASNLLQQCWQEAISNNHAKTQDELQQLYRTLAQQLTLDFEEIIGHDWHQLERLLAGIALLSSAPPSVQANVMAMGELLLTRLGHAALQQRGIQAAWLDAREALRTTSSTTGSIKGRYLNAQCDWSTDPALQSRLNQLPQDVVITQGFIAQNQEQETVLLGRGGSDISAAYFAAKLAASSCEIWTDVPGIYTANPQTIRAARQLVHLTYDEAQEIASMGAKVLHPRAILPVQQAEIPLAIRTTQDLQRTGTLIEKHTNSRPAIKSVLIKNNVVLLSMEAISMWHQAGFLADLFQCFKQHRVSIDLISTSQTNVTVSLDRELGLLDQAVIDALVSDLQRFAHVKLIAPCAVISIVGCKIRRILHQVSDVFQLFRSEDVFLLSQAANDLNFAFVVAQEQAERIAELIHNIIIQHSITHPCFGLSYDQEFSQPNTAPVQWWQQQVDTLLRHGQHSSPLYVYDQAHLSQTVNGLKSCQAIDRLFYAIKANTHPDILAVIHQHGLGFECVSIHEVEHVLRCFPAIDRQRILFTPNFAHRHEYQHAFELGVFVTVDNVHPLQQWPEVFAQRCILLRIDPGFGRGHHQYVETGGTHSKFGIPIDDVPCVQALTQQHQIQVIGLHAHSGSGILKAENWSILADTLIELTTHFPAVKILDLGGGLGIPEKGNEPELDLLALNHSLQQIKHAHPEFELWLEPGRYLVAQSGVILTRVSQIKTKGALHYIGVDAGMHTLIRPALYGAYHPIINLSKLNQPATTLSHIVGPICESGDVLARSRWMPETEEGDVLLIANTGAYAACMSMSYNLRPKAKEIMLNAAVSTATA